MICACPNPSKASGTGISSITVRRITPVGVGLQEHACAQKHDDKITGCCIAPLKSLFGKHTCWARFLCLPRAVQPAKMYTRKQWGASTAHAKHAALGHARAHIHTHLSDDVVATVICTSFRAPSTSNICARRRSSEAAFSLLILSSVDMIRLSTAWRSSVVLPSMLCNRWPHLVSAACAAPHSSTATWHRWRSGRVC